MSQIRNRKTTVKQDENGLFIVIDNVRYTPQADYAKPLYVPPYALVKEYCEFTPGDKIDVGSVRPDFVTVFQFAKHDPSVGNYIKWWKTPIPSSINSVRPVRPTECATCQGGGEIAPDTKCPDCGGTGLCDCESCRNRNETE